MGQESDNIKGQKLGDNRINGKELIKEKGEHNHQTGMQYDPMDKGDKGPTPKGEDTHPERGDEESPEPMEQDEPQTGSSTYNREQEDDISQEKEKGSGEAAIRQVEEMV